LPQRRNKDSTVKFAIYTINFGEFGDPRRAARMAAEAEAAGWDGYFVWDHVLGWPPDAPSYDPWVILSAVASATGRIRIGALVTPIARRRPIKLAREVVTLDHLSGGRLVFGAGLGGTDEEFAQFGEDADHRMRAEKLDEGLDVLAGLWSGEPFSYEGKHYRVDNVTFRPRPVQQPRVPVWIAGNWPNKKPFVRAARWDGIVTGDQGAGGPLTPDTFREITVLIREHRQSDAPFDVTYWGETSGNSAEDADRVAAYAEAGVTWWLENIHGWRGSYDEQLERVRLGPPRVPAKHE
jgi:probable F420-dependent oxidoreductase